MVSHSRKFEIPPTVNQKVLQMHVMLGQLPEH